MNRKKIKHMQRKKRMKQKEMWIEKKRQQKKILVSIIETRGEYCEPNKDRSLIHCPTLCPFYSISCKGVDTYKKAISLYVERHGKLDLMEILI